MVYTFTFGQTGDLVVYLYHDSMRQPGNDFSKVYYVGYQSMSAHRENRRTDGTAEAIRLKNKNKNKNKNSLLSKYIEIIIGNFSFQHIKK